MCITVGVPSGSGLLRFPAWSSVSPQCDHDQAGGLVHDHGFERDKPEQAQSVRATELGATLARSNAQGANDETDKESSGDGTPTVAIARSCVCLM
jgi:hypothetical protein